MYTLEISTKHTDRNLMIIIEENIILFALVYKQLIYIPHAFGGIISDSERT